MSETEKNPRVLPLVLTVVILLVAAGLGYLGLRVLDRLDAIESQVATMSEEASNAATASNEALEEARRAEESARAAAEGRKAAEEESLLAQRTAVSAQVEAETARQDADAARAEAERIRQEAEAELTRLEEALSKVVETRRTALGLVLNLGEDSIKFDFDKAELKPKERELLSRIAGILLTSSDYTVSVNGHTDDVGTEEYNQKLSERRAEVVHQYLLEVGVPPGIMTVAGWGKTKPRVEGTSDAARAKNRRVELGIVNSRVSYRSAAFDNR
ncbi:MAG TPA: OmpA family protein [Vicinamibacteria bacterium]|nr:OmpA family protein [Vicinamibacteria bacterium]